MVLWRPENTGNILRGYSPESSNRYSEPDTKIPIHIYTKGDHTVVDAKKDIPV